MCALQMQSKQRGSVKMSGKLVSLASSPDIFAEPLGLTCICKPAGATNIMES